jgi:hypothetical protein
MGFCTFYQGITIENLRESTGYEHQPYTYSLRLSGLAGCGLCKLFWLALTAPDYLPQHEYVTLPRPSMFGTSGVRVFSKVSEGGAEHLIVTCSYPCLTRDSDYDVELPEDFQNHRHAATLGQYNPEDDLEAWHADHARSVEARYPLETQGLKFIRHCLSECEQKHSSCQKGQAMLPKRVIDVGPPDGSALPYLHLSQGENANYIALSYCWGKLPTVTTTSKTIQERILGMPLETLPQTYVDAIKITRKLGIRYLWIDALCIIQDSLEDWKEQSALMGSIYRSAWLTIAALASTSSQDGVLNPRLSPSQPVISLKERTIKGQLCTLVLRDWGRFYHSSLGDFPAGPLSTRAWTLQERVLSSRILSFGTHELIWECETALECECQGKLSQLDSKSQGFKGSQFKGLLAIPTGNLSREDQERNFARQWRLIVTEYTKRSLTVSSDKLPALSGLASVAFETRLGGSVREESLPRVVGSASGTRNQMYLAGLWRADLTHDLLWTPVLGDRVTSLLSRSCQKGYRAPSWSWAAVDGPVEWKVPENLSPRLGVLEVLDASCVLATKDAFGQVAAGQLLVRGMTKELFYTHKSGYQAQMVDWDEYSFTGPIGNLDIDGEVQDGDRLTCLLVAQFDSPRRGAIETWYMVLRRKTWCGAKYNPPRPAYGAPIPRRKAMIACEHVIPFTTGLFERVGVIKLAQFDDSWFKGAQEHDIHII